MTSSTFPRVTPETTGVLAGRWIPGTTRIAFGGDYNPEQWPREVWLEDIALMKEAGVNLVSLGIFSWVLLEPRENEFDFAWLDDIIGLLADAGIDVDLGTPTAAPPAWFWKAYPDARPVTRDGVTLGHGSRGMASPSSPDYARAVTRIVTALGERYGRNPAVKLWHVHNEYGAPVSESYDEASVLAFRTWLEERHGSLDALNAAWGTTFWGQRYGAWDEIDAPRRSASIVNPAQRLDFARFSNAALLACFRLERDILHRLSPGIPVTTNFMATNCLAVDYWSWAHEVDIVANDHYLVAEREDNHVLLALDADLVRSLAGGDPWMLMEHSTSAVNWQPRNVAKAPGELRRNSMQHVARGADAILFFQWRASRYGAEKFHSAMLPHAGAGTRIFRETVALGSELGELAELRGSRVAARIAILWDWESFWAQDLEWRPSVELDHRRQIETFYTRLWEDGLTIDFAHPEHDLSGYDLVLAPSQYLLSTEGATNIENFVAAGGVFVASYFSGIVDQNETVPEGAMPGQLRGVLGLTVDEFHPLREGDEVELDNGLHTRRWVDEITTEGAETVVRYVDGPVAGRPAITRHALGAGSAWYLSTDLTAEQLGTVLAAPLAEAGLEPAAAELRGVETVVRRAEGVAFTTYLNHTDRAVSIPLAGSAAIGRPEYDGLLAAGDVVVLRSVAAE